METARLYFDVLLTSVVFSEMQIDVFVEHVGYAHSILPPTALEYIGFLKK